ncbi:MAG: ATP-binding cassette domain-containing protein [Candidatus Hydrogenedens sp.]|nr:ATP-binding cassette domain-containing protein [Candidatus Hydrogenedens sp.]
MAVITLDQVEVHYADFHALKGVTLEIGGGTVGLLGPNGAGKSTLMKTLLGFNRASRGTLTMFGMSMPRQALEVRQRLGYMPEREVVSTTVSAVSFLCYCGELFGMNRIDALERTHEVLNYVGLGESRYRKMETYSTGMLQRVKLAQALVHDPELLLLDEPTNGLDPDGRIEMLDVIKEVAARRGVTVILSSHLLPDVQHVCERVIMMKGGMVVRDGKVSDLTASLEAQYELGLREGVDTFQEVLRGKGCAVRVRHDGKLVVTVPEGADERLLFESALGSGHQIRHFARAKHSLEEVFLDALGAKMGV